ncbi:MAG: aconitase family protein [Phycisphaerales bacterium]
MNSAWSVLQDRPLDSPLPAAWLRPDRIVLDDQSGAATLREFARCFGPTGPVADPDKITIVSTVEIESAWDARRRTHEALQAFAASRSIHFVHAPGGCLDACAIERLSEPGQVIVTGGSHRSEITAQGGAPVRVTPLDLACALATGVVWWSRPPVQRFAARGPWPIGTTAHDLAILLRSQIRPGAWVDLALDAAAATPNPVPTLAALLIRESVAAGVTIGESTQPVVDHDVASIELSSLEPMLGFDRRSAVRASAAPAAPVDRVYIGSCTTGGTPDLRIAAEALAGRRVAIPTAISPATPVDHERLTTERLHGSDGPTLAEVFESAGCDLALPGCAGCVNALADAAGAGLDADRPLTVVATAVANVSTQRQARVFTASPVTAARIAISGRIGAESSVRV